MAKEPACVWVCGRAQVKWRKARKMDVLRSVEGMISKDVRLLVQKGGGSVFVTARFRLRYNKSRRFVGLQVEVAQFAHGG